MSRRRVAVVILCEDTQQEVFIRRFLIGMGWDKSQFRVNKNPKGKGSGEQWVREKFPTELKACRIRNSMASTVLIAVTDADILEVNERIETLLSECDSQLVPRQIVSDPVAMAIPKRNIETWIRYLEGNGVNEDEAYPKLKRERGCRIAVDNLVKLCQTTGLQDDSPPSLRHGCHEYQTRIRPSRTR